MSLIVKLYSWKCRLNRNFQKVELKERNLHYKVSQKKLGVTTCNSSSNSQFFLGHLVPSFNLLLWEFQLSSQLAWLFFFENYSEIIVSGTANLHSMLLRRSCQYRHCWILMMLSIMTIRTHCPSWPTCHSSITHSPGPREGLRTEGRGLSAETVEPCRDWWRSHGGRGRCQACVKIKDPSLLQ